MGMTKEEVLGIWTELLNNVEEAKGMAVLGVGVVKAFAGIVEPLFDGLGDYIVARRIKTLKAYVDAGYSKDQAVLMVLDTKRALQSIVENAAKNAQKE